MCGKNTRLFIFVSLILAAFSTKNMCAPESQPTHLVINYANDEIIGSDDTLGIRFKARRVGSKVIIDAEFDTKKAIHAEIDYQGKTLRVQSVSALSGELIKVEPRDIMTFQSLLAEVPSRIDNGTQLGDALVSFLELVAGAPSGIVLDLKP
jgi:hypothetical protein